MNFFTTLLAHCMGCCRFSWVCFSDNENVETSQSGGYWITASTCQSSCCI